MHTPIDGISATDTAPVSETGKFCGTFNNEISFLECVRHYSPFYGILSAVASDWSAFLTRGRESACIRFISKISPGNLSYALISSRSQLRESPYNLTLWNVFEIHICTAVIVDFQKSPSSDFIWRAPLATSSLAVGRYAAKKGSLRLPRGQLVASQRL